MHKTRGNTCYLVYPYLAQHFANSLAIASQTLGLSDAQSPIPIENTKKLGFYRSAIALGQKNSAAVAQELGAIAQSYLADQLGIDCRVQSQESGWIELQVAIADQWSCLLNLAKVSPLLNGHPPQPSPPQLPPELVFELQYAHARCFSLLQLAQQRLPSPQKLSIPWLEACFTTHPNSVEPVLWLRILNFPAQLQTRHQLPPSVQGPPTPRDKNFVPVKISYPISEFRRQAIGHDWILQFQKFYGSCSLFHLSPSDHQNLLTLRLTLFQALRNILELILTQLYQHTAPQTL